MKKLFLFFLIFSSGFICSQKKDITLKNYTFEEVEYFKMKVKECNYVLRFIQVYKKV